MLKPILILICSLSVTVWLHAQDKPIEKYSKKELLALVGQQTNQLTAQAAEIKALNKALDTTTQSAQKWMTRSNELSIVVKTCEQELLKSKEAYAELNKQYEILQEEPPKEIEVMDLYSFGYQPYKYNEKQYQLHLDAAREEVIKARMANIRDLVRLLQSHKIDDDIKKSLYLGFVMTYKGYLDGIGQERLTYYNEALEAELKKGITQKTYKELDVISKENRWIQMLERF